MIADAVKLGFEELGENAEVYARPPSSAYVGVMLHRLDGDWCVTFYNDSESTIWPINDGERISGPALYDPKFFEKCLQICNMGGRQ